ncbi:MULTISPECIES: CDP-alcohol phosphatidyltransferase family protein [Streptomyces]|uniref:CDP-alcohol phosphatidyltransferase family protein n=1 Tax=Streptomyces TaxID=1883 RepID=UPI0003C2D411|nr:MULTISPECIES: CDP-alcohol phosphatidyltransferase family protein [Streptomyces]ESP99542.1 transmembrane protein [Streptomyces sp. GBA 94-10 4N24]ESQ05590.1 transmembrane protein [Streptomyces sp. PVA_94-07]RPK59387.1 Inner membrane protein YnjF [Streptomyces sp. ADI96-15]RWZ77714.1 CDP-alcohol phosphatidyltransferase family protein [Streptomyces albidoflavus]UZN58501.1 transmembrane protein [Streptomyces sp. GBA 94-10 4N24]
MLDVRARAALSGPLDRAAAMLDRPAVTPHRLTALGMLTGLASAGSAAAGWWPAAMVLWLLSRLADGLDGPLARRRGTADRSGAGGFLDICADFLVYGAFVVGVAVGVGGPALPFLLVLLAYYVNGTVFLAFSSIAERTGRRGDGRLSGGRSLNFLGGLAEGGETIAVHTLWCLLPGFAHTIAWVWAAVVAVTAAHRVVTGYRQLR